MNIQTSCVAICAIAFSLPRAFAQEADWTRIYAVESVAVSDAGDEVHFTWCNTNWTACVTAATARVASKIPKSFDAGTYSGKMRSSRVRECRVSPDGRRVACRFRGDVQFRLRRGTTSSRVGELWLYDAGCGAWTNLVADGLDASCPAWLGDRALAYLKADGHGNVDVRRVDFAAGTDRVLVRGGDDDGEPPNHLASSRDGRTIVVRRGFDLWRYVLDGDGRVTLRSKLQLYPEKSWKRPAAVRNRWYDGNWNNDTDEPLAPIAGGNDVVFSTGGDLWAVKPGRGTNTVCRLWAGNGRVHARTPVASQDGKTVYYIRDHGDRSEIWSVRRAAEDKPWHKPGTLKNRKIVARKGMISNMTLSNAGDRLSWVDDATKSVFIVSTNAGSALLDVTPPGTFQHWECAWSPDDRHFAVVGADKNRNQDVWIVDPAGKKPAVNVSDHLLWDGSMQWTTNGAELAFSGTWAGSNEKRMFRVDMKKPLTAGCCVLVPKKKEKELRARLVKSPRVEMPVFRAEQKTVVADYRELAFLTVWSRLASRFAVPDMNGVDWEAVRRKYLPAARNVSSWRQFERVMRQMTGELDASHLGFWPTDRARKEWSIPRVPGGDSFKRESVRKTAEKVRRATSGRWGYVRVTDTDEDDYDRFLDDLYRQGNGRDGIILDLRGNSGGNCADLMLSCLTVRPHGYANWQCAAKGYLSDHLRRVQFSGEIVALIDEGVTSNGEMFAHALRTLGRAVLVGRPTAGEVLSTVRYDVLDVGRYMVPFGRWFTEDGVDMENNGAEPHVRVDDTPADWMRGADVQLERAISIAKKKDPLPAVPWIGDGLPDRDGADWYGEDPASEFMARFVLPPGVKGTDIRFVCAGFGEVRLGNGIRLMHPSGLETMWSVYDKTIYAHTLDGTSLAAYPATNTVYVRLGNGFYNVPPLRFWGSKCFRTAMARGRPCFKLAVDGLETPLEWKRRTTNVLANSAYLGTEVDATRPEDTRWKPAAVVKGPKGRIVGWPESNPRTLVRKRDYASSRWVRTGSVQVVDFGDNDSAVPDFRFCGEARGTRVEIVYGERLNPDGTVNVLTQTAGQIKRRGMGGPGAPDVACQRDVYVCRGTPAPDGETFAPPFTWHIFRYAEIRGAKNLLGPRDAARDVISMLPSDRSATPRKALNLSDRDLKAIHDLCLRTFQANMIGGVQSDCPGRERLGYGGDIVATCEAYMLNFDMRAIYLKILRDFADEAADDGWITETAPYVGIADRGFGGRAGPVSWALAVPELMDGLLRHYGETRALGFYPVCARYIGLVDAACPNGIVPRCIGDHEALERAPDDMTATAHWYRFLSLTSGFARLLGKNADAARFDAIAAKVRAAFAARYVKADGTVANGTQSAQAIAFYLGLVPDALRKAAFAKLVQAVETKGCAPYTGIFSTRYMLMALSENGRTDLARRIVLHKGFPGWLHMIDRGATTLWETWKESDNVFSNCHPMFGSVDEWIIKYAR